MQDVNAVKHWKLEKYDGEEGLFSDHLINAPNHLSIILCHVLMLWLFMECAHKAWL